MRGQVKLVGALSLLLSTTTWAAGTGMVIYNDYSGARVVDVHAGTNDDCNENPDTGVITIPAQSRSDVLPYGPDVGVSIVCARYQIGNRWSDWYTGTCEGSGVCEIDMR
jgi:hypothetical protein